MSVKDAQTGLPALQKQPGETRTFTMDFAGKLGNTTIAGVSGTVVESQERVAGSAALTLGSAQISPDGTKVLLSIGGGTDREDYKVTITVACDNSDILEGDGLLKVREI